MIDFERLERIMAREDLEGVRPHRISLEFLRRWTAVRRFHRIRRELGVKRGSVDAITLALLLGHMNTRDAVDTLLMKNLWRVLRSDLRSNLNALGKRFRSDFIELVEIFRGVR